MKKKLFAIMLALALLVTTGVFAVQADSGTQVQVDTCPHCQKAMDSITWSSWSFTGGEIAGGHYYLAREYYSQTGTIEIPEGVDVCLDLRDKMYFATDIHPFDIYGDLTVMDSQGNGQFITTGKSGYSGGFAKIMPTGTLNILGGTIRRLDKEGITIYVGGLIYINGGTMKMSGGMLAGGIAKANSTYDAQGGNIYMKGGSFEFTGGVITGGMAISDTGKKAQGGNIFMYANAAVTIDGGQVIDGYSDQDGGNIFLSGSSLTMHSGAITGGHAVRHGGNIAHLDDTSSENSVSLLGGSVSGGVAGGKLQDLVNGTFARGSGGGGNYYSYSINGALTVSNCTISGDMKFDAIKNVTLSGATKIGLGKANGINVPAGTIMDVSGLTHGAEIYVCAMDVFTKPIPAEDADRIADYFKGAIRTSVELTTDFTLKGTQGSKGFCPHCNEEVTWYTAFNATSGELHRYLTGNSYNDVNHASISADIVLDLSGYTVYRGTKRIMLYENTPNMTVMDSFGGGKLEGVGTDSNTNIYGGVVDILVGGTFTMYSGTIRMVPGDSASAVRGGGLIYSRHANTSVTIHGGVLSGGELASSGAYGGGNIYLIAGNELTIDGGIIKGGKAGTFNGGNIYCAGTTDISGGFIVGGTAADGGNLYATGDVDISGGTIFGGKAADNTATTSTTEGRGGNMYVSGKATVSGGTVTGGKAYNGGNAYITGSIKISENGLFSAGIATNNGGNVYITGSTNITGGTVAAGMATNGGNLYVYASGKTHGISGGLITGGIAADNATTTTKDEGKGGNLYLTSGTALTVSDKAVISRGIANYGGGNVWITGGSSSVGSLTITGGKILGGRTSANTRDGGSVYADGGTLNVQGGELSDGYASRRGGNVYMSNAYSKVNISGGTITGGYAYKFGGNLYHNAGVTKITGGAVSNGKAARGGNLCLGFAATASMTIDGEACPQIIGGTALCEGGNIYHESAAHQPGSAYTNGSATPWLAIGNCVIEDGEAASFGQDIFVNKNARIRVLENFKGTTSVYFFGRSFENGMLDATCDTTAGDFTGKLLIENMDGNPFALNKGGLLAVADAAYVKNGVFNWFVDNAALMKAYDTNADYILAGSGDLTLNGGTYTIDLAGKTVNITGSGAVYGMDSANDTYETYGSATFGENITLAGFRTQLGDRSYFALSDGNIYTFHRAGIDITSVSLRPSNAGLYYSALWQCDEMLAEKIDAFGVVVSLAGAPDDDFLGDKTSRYTYQTGFTSGITGNGVLIHTILQDDQESMNSEYAKQPIYAAAYITVDGKNYVGSARSHSLHDILQLLSDNIYEYHAHANTLQNFMDAWDDRGLTGSDWDFDYQVPAAVIALQQQYVGTTAYHGELHDHANTGGTSDGNYTLTEWLTGIKQLDMDFATIVDHKQYLHMELPEWDNKYFIGGSEAMAMPKDLAAATQTKMHFNMIFHDPMDLKAAVEEYDALYPNNGFRHYTDATTGEWHFTYLQGFEANASGTGVAVNCRPTKAQMAQLVEIVRKHNGLFVHVHPKSSDYIKSTDPLDYWYADYTGLEVYYTIWSDRNSTATKNNYKLWTDLLKLGKKVWATAGNDEHAMPSDKALTTIYSTVQDAQEFVERAAVGNFTAGAAGVRMVVGDQVMGYETDFTGKELAFSVGDFHSSVYDPTHTYEAVLIADEEVVGRWEISCEKTFYHTAEADASVDYYRVEVYDLTTGEMLALSNPIWNTAK